MFREVQHTLWVMDETALNRKIEQEQQRSMEQEASTIKLLLLGPGDCGKTTLRKMMRHLFGTGFPTEMREEFAPVVVTLLLSGFQEVLHAMETQLNIPLANAEAGQAALKSITAALAVRSSELDKSTVQACNTLLDDAGFLQALQRRSEIQLDDCWATFADKLETWPDWAGPKWLPSTEDCIASRQRTTGVHEERFTIDSVPFLLVDVGGQRSERRKWVHVFADAGITAVIFLAAISEYDQVLFEDRKKNRLEESLDLFEEVCANRSFQHLDMILFLNKRDLFERKFVTQGIPLDAIKFPGAPAPHDLKAGLQYIEKLFLERNSKKKKVYVHVTTATDPDNIKRVFDACKNIVLASSMNDSGF